MAENPAASPAPVDVYIQSKLPADNGYGQNGYRGPSSDLPGNRTSSNFLPDSQAAFAKAKSADWQTRKSKSDPYPTTHGMHAASPGGTVPGKLNYPGAPGQRKASTLK
jgi:hypothetical protein